MSISEKLLLLLERNNGQLYSADAMRMLSCTHSEYTEARMLLKQENKISSTRGRNSIIHLTSVTPSLEKQTKELKEDDDSERVIFKLTNDLVLMYDSHQWMISKRINNTLYSAQYFYTRKSGLYKYFKNNNIALTEDQNTKLSEMPEYFRVWYAKNKIKVEN